MAKKIIIFFMCTLILFHYTCVVKAEGEEETNLDLYSKAAVLMDASSGRVLYSKNGTEVLPMASTTKIMTCMIALENCDISETVEVSAYAASMPKVHLGMKAGEQFILKDLLYSLMLESHNDSAVAIAEHIGRKSYTQNMQADESENKEIGKEENTKEDSKNMVLQFAEMMNAKAAEIGCDNTYFITPNGLDASANMKDGSQRAHTTTAEDLAKIMAYCINKSPKAEEFLEITRTANYSFSNVEGKRSYSCNNHNAFLTMMDGALSGKTGFTAKAGYCYVGALERDGKKFSVALLACGWPNHKSWKWSDTKQLMNYGLDHYEYRSFTEIPYDESKLKPILVENGQTENIGELAYTGVQIENADTINQGEEADTINQNELDGLLLRDDENIEVVYEINNKLKAPITAGTKVGSICYIVNGNTYKTEEIETTNTILEIDFLWCMDKVWNKFAV